MSPVNRAGSVSEISPHYSSMCSYEKAGQPGYRDLGNRAEHFPSEHSSPVTWMKLESSCLDHLGNWAEISHMNRRKNSPR